MNKLLTITFALCSALMAMACSSNDPEESNMPENTEQNGAGTAKGKMLVIYFSRAGENWQVGNVERGNTAIMVDYIQEFADVDVFEIVPEVAYPSNYMECVNYVNDIEIPQNLRPTYKGDISNIADYGTVLIGGPIWCGQPPYIFRTFFEKHPELADKTIIPFGTHGGSGVGRSVRRSSSHQNSGHPRSTMPIMRWTSDWSAWGLTTSTCFCCIIRRLTTKMPIRLWSAV